MVQEFHVIRCVKCQTFQVQQVKKATTRWSCRVCGEKQSLLKEFGRGSAADCRRHVQKLNTARGATLEEGEEMNTWSLRGEEDEDGHREEVGQLTQTNRWSKYLDAPVGAEPELNQREDRQLHGNIWKRKREEADLLIRNTSADQNHRPNEQSSSPRTTTLNQSRMTPSLGSGSRWTHFLNSEPCVSGRSQLKYGVGDIRRSPRPLPPASMFETEEDFSVDGFETL